MRNLRDDQKFLLLRINIVMWAMVITFVFLAGAFWWVQGVQADKYRNLSESNALREVVIHAKRGWIMDRTGKIFADNQAAVSLTLSRSDLKKFTKTDPQFRGKMIRYVSETLELPPAEIEARLDKDN